MQSVWNILLTQGLWEDANVYLGRRAAQVGMHLWPVTCCGWLVLPATLPALQPCLLVVTQGPEEDASFHPRRACVQVGVAFVDRDYPSRAAFSVVDKVLDDYADHSCNAWRAATEDSSDALVVLDLAIVKYQVRRGLAVFGGPVCCYMEPF